MFTDNQCCIAQRLGMNTIYLLMKHAFHPIITFLGQRRENKNQTPSYLVRREPACLWVDLEVFMGGHDAVLDLAGGVELVAPGVSVLGLHLDHHSAWKTNGVSPF